MPFQYPGCRAEIETVRKDMELLAAELAALKKHTAKVEKDRDTLSLYVANNKKEEQVCILAPVAH